MISMVKTGLNLCACRATWLYIFYLHFGYTYYQDDAFMIKCLLFDEKEATAIINN